MSEQNELALVLSRIQALSKSKMMAATPEPAVDDGIVVLTDLYQGQDALTAVDFSQLFNPETSASASHAASANAQQHGGAEASLSLDEAMVPANSQLEPVSEPLSADSSIRFLPVDDNNGEALENLQDPVREDLVAAVLEDIQPVMSDVIRQALIREVQVLGPRLSAELEAALSENVRLRVLGALRNEKSNKD